jgi:type II secretion system protein N
MKRTGTILFYGAYLFFAVGFFIYLLFPSQVARDVLVAQVAQAHPDIRIRTDGVHPTFPPGVKLASLGVTYADMPLFSMGHLNVLPGLTRIFGDHKTFAFNGPVGGGGALKGHATLSLDPSKSTTRVTASLAAMPLEAIEMLKRVTQVGLTGTMTAYVDFDSEKSQGGIANINMDIKPLRIVFNAPLLGLEQLQFTQVQSEVALTPKMLHIKRWVGTGAQLESNISGSIVFLEPFNTSRLNLTLLLKPQSGFAVEQKDTMIGALLASTSAQQRGIQIRIAGTLEKPTYVVR